MFPVFGIHPPFSKTLVAITFIGGFIPIVGSSIHARPWELQVAMLVMEAAFGAPGLVAAPICYAYLKDELVSRGPI